MGDFPLPFFFKHNCKSNGQKSRVTILTVFKVGCSPGAQATLSLGNVIEIPHKKEVFVGVVNRITHTHIQKKTLQICSYWAKGTLHI